MVRREIRDLGWIAPSLRLSDTLERADRIASEQRHRELMLEHVVLGLTDDTDAARVLEANGVDVARFRDYVARYIAAVDYRWPQGSPSDAPVPDATLRRIFDVASAAAETSGRREIDGALLVAAIIGEGASNAAAMLSQHGLRVDDEEPIQPANVQRIVESSQETPSNERGRGQDLSDIHRLLSSPAEPIVESMPQVRQGERNPIAGDRHVDDSTALATNISKSHDAVGSAGLQRTRPKVQPAGRAGSAPKAVMPANGTGTTMQQRQNAMHTHSSGSTVGTNGQWGPVSSPGKAVPVTPPIPAVPPPAQDHPRGPSYQRQNEEDTDDGSVLENERDPITGLAQIDANILADILPAKMCVGVPEIVEIRVLNSDIDLLTGQLEGRDVAHAESRLVSRSLSLRLRSPNGAFSIEARSPEVQWLDANETTVGDDATSWRWQITGQRRGDARLQLLASARTVANDGRVLETAMPEQSATVRLKRGFSAAFKRLTFVLMLFLSGCAVGLVARPAYRMLESALLG